MKSRRAGWSVVVAAAAAGGIVGLSLPDTPPVASVASCATSNVSSAPTATQRPKAVPAQRPPSDEATLESMWLSVHLAARVRSLQASLDTARDELDRRAESRALVSEAIDGLTEPELRSVLATALRLSSTELDEIHDLAAFATRASEIAMDGLLYDAPEPVVDAEVFFTSVMPDEDANIVPIDRFTADDDRIFAVFETPVEHPERITMKWSRTDDPEILLLARKNIRPEDAYGFVYRRRGPGWTPGAYRVDVFGGDESMPLLASGRYVIE